MIAFVDRLSRLLNAVASIAIAAVALLVNYEAFSRYLLKQPTNWIIPGSSMVLVYITFFAAGWVQKIEGHVRIDSFLNLLPARGRLYLETLGSLIGAAVCGVWLTQGIRVVADNYHNNVLIVDSFGAISRAYVVGVIPVGAMLMGFYLLRKAWAGACSLRAGTFGEKRTE